MLRRWDPMLDMEKLHDQINRVLGDAMGQGGVEPAQRAWTPPVDAWETDSGFSFAVALPGVDSQSIEVKLEGETLTIRGERKPEERKYHRQEIPAGPFFRSFILGVPVKNDGVEAAYRNGILEVVVPKAEAAVPRKIEVKVT